MKESNIKEIREVMQTSWQQAKLVSQSINMMEKVWAEDNSLSVTSVIHTLLAGRCGMCPDDFTKACNTWGSKS